MRKALLAGTYEEIKASELRDTLIYFHTNYGIEREGFSRLALGNDYVRVTWLKSYRLIDRTYQPSQLGLPLAKW